MGFMQLMLNNEHVIQITTQKMNKTTFCKLLGVELANTRWSWGGTRPDGSLVLIVWADEIQQNRAMVKCHSDDASPGNEERRRHLELLSDGALCYIAIALDDGSGRHQTIGKLRTDYLFNGINLTTDEDGNQWLDLGERIPMRDLRQ